MRNKTEVIYKTDRFSIFKNKNKTFSIEGVINKKRIRKRAKTMDEAKAFWIDTMCGFSKFMV